jgi:hypothetical protein
MDRPVNRTVLYLIVVTLLCALAAGVNSIWYANRVAQESNRNWCSLVNTLDDTYRQQPPTTPTGRQVAAEIHALRVRLGC